MYVRRGIFRATSFVKVSFSFPRFKERRVPPLHRTLTNVPSSPKMSLNETSSLPYPLSLESFFLSRFSVFPCSLLPPVFKKIFSLPPPTSFLLKILSAPPRSSSTRFRPAASSTSIIRRFSRKKTRELVSRVQGGLRKIYFFINL